MPRIFHWMRGSDPFPTRPKRSCWRRALNAIGDWLARRGIRGENHDPDETH